MFLVFLDAFGHFFRSSSLVFHIISMAPEIRPLKRFMTLFFWLLGVNKCVSGRFFVCSIFARNNKRRILGLLCRIQKYPRTRPPHVLIIATFLFFLHKLWVTLRDSQNILITFLCNYFRVAAKARAFGVDYSNGIFNIAASYYLAKFLTQRNKK